ncbi:aminoglycoside phosphotransferase family protein [Actinospica robiniae]|uniref:aminoglycoside phosphotransferase family protein n=1 Tax=Actinospica robiniae TaxID=304901 RepID=UPI000407DDD2|nr:aminoglycoside phosphotransferase family protein [Actinospica robiniae]
MTTGDLGRVERIGNTVHRPAAPWTPAVHDLLRHLESVGYERSPRVLGFDELGREVLTWIEGESGPDGWAKVVDDRGLISFAHMLRDYHDAVAGYRPAATTQWSSKAGGVADGEVVCHGDFGPWNAVWDGLRPIGLIDWDHARPAPRLHDVAYALEYTAPFRDDATCLRWLRYPEPPDRRRRLEVFATAYGLTDTTGLVDAVIEVQENDVGAVARLAEQGHEPQATWVAEGHLDELRERVAWSRANRHLIDYCE